jgi:ElaB/YqjD/DUF883 family membrane-anchored ribosome-binding protein
MMVETCMGLADELRAERDALSSFTAGLEGEFLELGNLLHVILDTATNVRQHSDAVIGSVSGRAEDSAIDFAFQLLKKAEDLAEATREQYERGLSTFEQLTAALAQIARERRALRSILLPLKINPMQLRIEASWFDAGIQAEFSDLAASIDRVLEDLASGVTHRFEELERTATLTEDTATSLKRLSDRQSAKTRNMLGATREHLSALDKVLRDSERIAKNSGDAGNNIFGGAGKAIVALQCQDMARQKFEHIQAVIDEMIAHVDGLGKDELDSGTVQFIGQAGRVQLTQLQTVFRQLMEAAGEIEAGLRTIDLDTKAFARSAVDSGGAGIDSNVIALAMRSIREVLDVIHDAVGGVGRVSELVKRLSSAFTDCTSQVMQITERLIVMAVNVQVTANKVDAATMEVIARNARNCADLAMHALRAISKRVDREAEMVGDLDQRLADFRELAAMEQNVLEEEASRSTDKLCVLEQNLAREIKDVRALEQKLSPIVAEALGRIRFPELVSTAMERVLSFFAQLVAQYSL